jgi:hypothetical protein
METSSVRIKPWIIFGESKIPNRYKGNKLEKKFTRRKRYEILISFASLQGLIRNLLGIERLNSRYHTSLNPLSNVIYIVYSEDNIFHC